MANIVISNLHPASSELLLTELTISEQKEVSGGIIPLLIGVGAALLLSGCGEGCAHGKASHGKGTLPKQLPQDGGP